LHDWPVRLASTTLYDLQNEVNIWTTDQHRLTQIQKSKSVFIWVICG
jgi:hypothetical protein